MAGATERTRQSEDALGKTKGTHRFSLSLSLPLSLSLSLAFSLSLQERSSLETEQMNAVWGEPQGCRVPGKEDRLETRP